MRSLGLALIQYDWYPYIMGKFRHRMLYVNLPGVLMLAAMFNTVL